MTKYQSGADALNELNKTNEGGGSNVEFSPFKSGTTYTVKVLGTSDLISFYSYGIFKQVNSFVAKNPSKKSAKGFPIENLTPFDKAWKYHADKSEKFGDEHSQEAYKYRARQRFAMGFIDLNTGDPIIIDLSKNQAQAVHETIQEYVDELDDLAFKLAKTGSGTNTTVSLSPIINRKKKLTDEENENFDNAPDKFDMNLFDGILYEMDDDEQIEKLIEVGFDVSLIGLEPPNKSSEGVDHGEVAEITDDDLPF